MFYNVGVNSALLLLNLSLSIFSVIINHTVFLTSHSAIILLLYKNEIFFCFDSVSCDCYELNY